MVAIGMHVNMFDLKTEARLFCQKVGLKKKKERKKVGLIWLTELNENLPCQLGYMEDIFHS